MEIEFSITKTITETERVILAGTLKDVWDWVLSEIALKTDQGLGYANEQGPCSKLTKSLACLGLCEPESMQL